MVDCLTQLFPLDGLYGKDAPLDALCCGYSAPFCMLEKLANQNKIVGLTVRNQKVTGLGFTDDTLMFLKACNVNIAHCMNLLGLYMRMLLISILIFPNLL